MTARLLAEFADLQRIVDAARRARAARLRPVDAFTPFPVDGLHEFLRCARSCHPPRHVHRRHDSGDPRLRPGVLFGGYQLPYNSGGRPLDAWPAFMLVPFAIGILAAAIAGFIALLWRAGCPGCIIPCLLSTVLNGQAKIASSWRWTPERRSNSSSNRFPPQRRRNHDP